jgi:hypothetical protein
MRGKRAECGIKNVKQKLGKENLKTILRGTKIT